MPGRLNLYIEFRESVADGRNLNTGMRLAAIDMRDRVLATRLMTCAAQKPMSALPLKATEIADIEGLEGSTSAPFV